MRREETILRKTKRLLFVERRLPKLSPMNYIKHYGKEILWRTFKNKKKLSSGIITRYQCPVDLLIMNEIFDQKMYDFAIGKALDSALSGQALNILDLGANVGYFVLRAADLILESRRSGLDFQITCVEGSPFVFKRLKAYTDQPLLRGKVRLINGLVGKRRGQARIYEQPLHGQNSVVKSDQSLGFYDVEYTDLLSLYEKETEIDLLKCDIEGSELAFLENYPDLLERVKYLVFEFHSFLCDVPKCYEILKNKGFEVLDKQVDEKKKDLEIVVLGRKGLV